MNMIRLLKTNFWICFHQAFHQSHTYEYATIVFLLLSIDQHVYEVCMCAIEEKLQLPLSRMWLVECLMKTDLEIIFNRKKMQNPDCPRRKLEFETAKFRKIKTMGEIVKIRKFNIYVCIYKYIYWILLSYEVDVII